MLDSLKYFYRSITQARIIPIWKQYILSIKPQQEILKRRYLDIDIISNQKGIKLIDFILREADIPFLAKFDDDFYVYTTQVIPLIQQFKNTFDLARSGKAYQELFIKKYQAPASEYLVPVDDNDWLKFFPMNSSFPKWDKLVPLKMWDHDSSEYTLDMMSGNLRFHAHDPKYVLWLLDIPTLVMKAVKFHQWRKEFTTLPGFENPYSKLDFIQRHVCDSFHDDSIHLWQFKMHQLAVNIVLEMESKEQINEMSKRSQSQYGSVGARFKETMEDLIDFYTQVQKGSILPQVVMNTDFYYDCTKSFADIVKDIPVYYDIPHLSQYKYLRLIRDLPYLEYLIKVYMLHPKSTQYKNLMVRLNSLVTKWINNTPVSLIKNPYHQSVVKSKLEWMQYISAKETATQ